MTYKITKAEVYGRPVDPVIVVGLKRIPVKRVFLQEKNPWKKTFLDLYVDVETETIIIPETPSYKSLC